METLNAKDLENVLCPIHYKKVKLICLSDNCDHFFICGDCFSKDSTYCKEHMPYLTSIEDFKYQFIDEVLRDAALTQETVKIRLDQIIIHEKMAKSKIEDDFVRIEESLISQLRKSIEIAKQELISQFLKANKQYKDSLKYLSDASSNILEENLCSVRRLNDLLVNNIEDSKRIKSCIQTLLEHRKKYILTSNHAKVIKRTDSQEDLKSYYNFTTEQFGQRLLLLRKEIENTISTSLCSDDFYLTVISRPQESLSPALKKHQVEIFTLKNFTGYLEPSIVQLASIETSSHTNHRILSIAKIDTEFIATSHTDCTFKVWALNPAIFDVLSDHLPKAANLKKIEESFQNKEKIDWRLLELVMKLFIARYLFHQLRCFMNII